MGFLLDSAWLFWFTAGFLALALAALAFRAKQRRGHGPLFLGLLAASILLPGKFILESEVAMYAGILMLVGASLWNSWPQGRRPACESCSQAPSGQPSE